MAHSNTKYTQQSILNDSFDDEQKVLVFEQVQRKSDGSGLEFSSPATEETLQSIAGMNIPSYDTIEATYPTTSSEVYTYKNGSATVSTVTVLYSDSSKKILTSVTKS